MESLQTDISKRSPSRVEIMGIPIDPLNMEQTVDLIDAYIDEGKFCHAMGVNADKFLQMKDDAWMDACVRRCEVINADGASMVMAADRLGKNLPERVAGVDLMWELCSLAEKRGYPIYLLGAKPEVVEKAADVLQEKYPALKIAGFRDGYFSESEFESVAAEVEQAQPTIIFVGITSPKKEHLIECCRDQGSQHVFVGVGGTFDVISGNMHRAPMWMRKMNLEWLYRLFQEPRRLVKRYVVGNTRFYMCLRKESKIQKKANA